MKFSWTTAVQFVQTPNYIRLYTRKTYFPKEYIMYATSNIEHC